MKEKTIKPPSSIISEITDNQMHFLIERPVYFFSTFIWLAFFGILVYHAVSHTISPILGLIVIVIILGRAFYWAHGQFSTKEKRKKYLDRVKGRTEVHIDNKQLRVTYLGKFNGDKRKDILMDVKEIVQLFVLSYYQSKQHNYRLFCHLQDGTNKLIVTGLESNEEGLYLMKEIEGFLKIKHIPVYESINGWKPIFLGMGPWVYKRNHFTEDLTVIKGIGPILEFELNCNYIFTYAHLKKCSTTRLDQILKLAKPAYQMHDTTTWPIQAGLAAAGKWEELTKFQQEMDEGK